MCLFDLHNVSADWPESVSMWSFHGVMLPKQMRWLRSLIVFAFFSPLCFHFFLQTDTLYKSLLSLQRGALNNITTAEYLGKAWHYSVIWNSEALMGAWETGRGATTGCAIPPTTFSQLIKLGSRPMRDRSESTLCSLRRLQTPGCRICYDTTVAGKSGSRCWEALLSAQPRRTVCLLGNVLDVYLFQQDIWIPKSWQGECSPGLSSRRISLPIISFGCVLAKAERGAWNISEP